MTLSAGGDKDLTDEDEEDELAIKGN